MFFVGEELRDEEKYMCCLPDALGEGKNATFGKRSAVLETKIHS